MFEILTDDFELSGESFDTEQEAIAYALIDLPSTEWVYFIAKDEAQDHELVAMVFQGVVWRPEPEYLEVDDERV